MHPDDRDVLYRWCEALEARHLADLRVPEVTRALRALSSSYVERRHRGRASDTAGHRVQATLDSAGKRAAFALFYAPLHFIAAAEAARALGRTGGEPSRIVDLGCGTGAAGAAWAVASGLRSPVLGLDRHPWAVSEARWTYRQLGVRGEARQADATRVPHVAAGGAVVAAYLLNELPDSARAAVENRLIDAAQRGVAVLVIEPIARTVTPWWDETARRVLAIGGRADTWRLEPDLPPIVRLFDKAAGLDHRELTFRTLWIQQDFARNPTGQDG